MRPRGFLGVLLVVLLVILPVEALATGGSAGGGIKLSTMIKSVQVALRDTQKLIHDNRLPELEGVELTLKTVSTGTIRSGFTLYVVSVGGSGESKATSSVRLKLVPPPREASSGARQADAITTGLTSALRAALDAIKVAREGKPKLDADLIEIVLAFALVRGVDGGLELLFPPFEIAAGGSVSSSEVQTIKVTFK